MSWTLLRKKRFYGICVAAAFLGFSFWGINLKASWAAIKHIEPLYFIPVFCGVFLMPLFRAQRLKIIIDPEKKIDGWRVFSIFNVAQLLNSFVPALGPVARVLFFSRMLDLTKTFSFTMVVLEVLFDGLTLLMLIFAASSLFVFPDWLVRGEAVILFICLLFFGFFYFLLHKRDKSTHSLPRWMYRLPRHWLRKVINISNSFLAGLRMLKSGRHLILVIVLSLGSWLVHALAVFSLIKAFGFNLPFWGALVILIVNTAAIMVQVSPGNLGTFQFACILGLSFFGIPKDAALSFSLVLHAVEIVPIALLGTYYSFSSHIHWKEYQTPESLHEQEDFAAGKYSFNGSRDERRRLDDDPLEVKTIDRG